MTWDTGQVVARNNILSNSYDGSGSLIETFDNNSPDKFSASEMLGILDSNAYFRASSTAPSWLAVWSRKDQSALVARTLGEFRDASGKETGGIGIDNQSSNPFFAGEDKGNFSLIPGSPALKSGSPLPSDVAAAVGVAADVPVDRGALVWPGGRSSEAVRAGDLNGDGSVGITDLSILLTGWGKPGPADLNADGVVSITDLSILLSRWG